MNDIRKTLRDLFQDSTIHAIPRIINSKLFIVKSIWLVSLLAAASFCVFLIRKSIFSYLNYDVVTIIENIPQMPAVFPMVIICNSNVFQKNASIVFIQQVKNKSTIYESLNNDEKLFFLLNEMKTHLNEQEIKQYYVLSLNQTLIKCRFNNFDCNQKDFEWFFNAFYGSCFRFNGKEPLKKIVMPGDFYGLKLEINAGDSTKMPDFISENGYRLFILDQLTEPTLSEGIDIATGMKTNIDIKKTVVNRLEYPYNKCKNKFDEIEQESVLVQVFSKLNRTYRQKECFNNCFQKQVNEKCNCFVNNYEKLNELGECKTNKQLECALQAWKILTGIQRMKICEPFCPEECSSIYYSMTTSFSNYPSKSYAEKQLLTNKKIMYKDYQELKMNVLALNIYFGDLSYTLIGQQAKMDLIDLISNIGGLLGLFVGMSFLSVIEFVQVFVEIIYVLINYHSFLIVRL